MKNSKKYKTSTATPYKQLSFADFLDQYFSILNAIYMNPRNKKSHELGCLYFDLNGGVGTDPKTGDGSPIIFHKKAIEHGIKYRAHIYELDKETFGKLAVSTSGFPDDFHIYNQDHSVIVDKLDGIYQPLQHGIIYCDPTDLDINFDLLKVMAKYYPKLDIVINVAAGSWKRSVTVHDWERLPDILSTIKGKLIFRKPIMQSQWTILVCTNFKGFKAWESRHFQDLDTDLGREWYNKLFYSANDLKKMNPQLPGF